ncbi:Protochlorophyllide-dependent translocon component 52, chloroplastic [Tetrabaena socialis]|uniref:Protochlorophyllide-dependent translocon component 52, chloroplastic n=1 Tax=Tetrabaena socialis TaxID=47790 RepID=A0A2J7ZN01_9CHLO|nr:Protochlorophyllide-dependent translocon component 52, chloroplastic [Tetrabaena socialis]|eukprot:PNH01637.1 Protochlorophyllide-dependent translocon component 52, chloroplastic [Tetrabaena socialis]
MQAHRGAHHAQPSGPWTTAVGATTSAGAPTLQPPPADSQPAGSSAPSAAPSAASGPFPWTSAWYPVAASQPVPHTCIKELMGGPAAEGHVQRTQWFVRDLPLRYDTLLENVLDPSHVPFAHHGVQGRRENEKGTETSILDEGVAVGGFAFRFDSKSARFPPSRVEFRAPIHARYGAGFRALHVYCVPTRPGWSRLYATFLQDTRVPVPLPPVINAIFCLVESIPWLEHISQRNKVLDGDTYMIHLTERLLLEQNNAWRTSYFMPAAADASVVATRRWLDEFGGAVPTCEPCTPMPPQMSKADALDRYSQHTAGCRHCKKALKNVEAATVVAAACGALAALWLVARAVAGLPLLAPASGMALLAMAACGGAVAFLRALRAQFFYVEYVHAHAK